MTYDFQVMPDEAYRKFANASSPPPTSGPLADVPTRGGVTAPAAPAPQSAATSATARPGGNPLPAGNNDARLVNAPDAPYGSPLAIPNSQGRPAESDGPPTQGCDSAGRPGDFIIPKEVLNFDAVDRRTFAPVVIRWCHIHNDYFLFAKPPGMSPRCWHSIRRATPRDVSSFKLAWDHDTALVDLDRWDPQPFKPLDRSDAVARFNACADRACAEVLALSNFWDSFRDLLPIAEQLAVKERFNRCRAGLRCFEPMKEPKQ